jgi:tRNA (cytidine/uridine-2'-O-)-methyltransferase
MFHIILYQPEIPPNTGNIIRLCANTGCQLHLVRPLGFTLEDKQLVRAGLDYHEFATVQVHDSLAACLNNLPHPNPPPEGEGATVSLHELVTTRRIFALTTKGSQPFHEIRYREGDAFLFGPESRGLPANVLEKFDAARRIRLPMLPHSRSLNLSNAVAVTVFEAWRQCGFLGSSV